MITKAGIVDEIRRADPDRSWVVEVFDQLPSTNEYLRKRDRPEQSDAIELCATDWQTAGRGRRGKDWTSMRGNVTFTLRQRLRRPAAELMGLSLVAGIAVVGVVNQRLGIDASVKWPNDVLVKARKLGGLLIELQPDPKDRNSTLVTTGIGANVRHQPDMQRLGIGATSLEALNRSPELDRNALIAKLAVAVASHYVEFETTLWPGFETRWEAVDALFGRSVTVSGSRELTGAACGVSASGALLVDTGSGMEEVVAGEVSVRPV